MSKTRQIVTLVLVAGSTLVLPAAIASSASPAQSSQDTYLVSYESYRSSSHNGIPAPSIVAHVNVIAKTDEVSFADPITELGSANRDTYSVQMSRDEATMTIHPSWRRYGCHEPMQVRLSQPLIAPTNDALMSYRLSLFCGTASIRSRPLIVSAITQAATVASAESRVDGYIFTAQDPSHVLRFAIYSRTNVVRGITFTRIDAQRTRCRYDFARPAEGETSSSPESASLVPFPWAYYAVALLFEASC